MHKSILASAVIAAASASLVTGNALAQQTTYNEPTRGFTLERGGIAEEGSAAVDLATGIGAMGNVNQLGGTAGGIRLGTPGSEVIINQGNMSGANGTNTDMFVKFGMQPLDMNGNNINWNVYGGVSYIDIDPDGQGQGTDYLNLGAGAAFTMDIDALKLNVNPELVLDDTTPDRDTRFEFGFGAHYQLPDTDFGRFSPGIEYTVISADAQDDNLLTAGTRWAFNDRISMDFMVYADAGATAFGIPGFVRLNAAF